MNEPLRITSRDNPLLVRLRKLLHDGAGYRKLGLLWLEGDHLCRAALARGVALQQVLLSEAGWADPALREIARGAGRCAVLPDALWRTLSTLPSPAAIGAVLALPPPAAIEPGLASIVLDRVQDAGNAGSMLRSAAAFGVRQVVALKGSVALWSPKVLRAGMGAHFALRVVEGVDAEALDALALPLLATSPHAALRIDAAALPQPAAWVFGHEGQGIAPALLARCALTLAIPQPGGEESLNVAAAAAVCLYQQALAAAPDQVPQKVR